jgi:hypothetical protein
MLSLDWENDLTIRKGSGRERDVGRRLASPLGQTDQLLQYHSKLAGGIMEVGGRGHTLLQWARVDRLASFQHRHHHQTDSPETFLHSDNLLQDRWLASSLVRR